MSTAAEMTLQMKMAEAHLALQVQTLKTQAKAHWKLVMDDLIPPSPNLVWDVQGGLREIQITPSGLQPGAWRRINGQWWLRVKRRTAGKRWKPVDPCHLPKRIRVEALLLEIQL